MTYEIGDSRLLVTVAVLLRRRSDDLTFAPRGRYWPPRVGAGWMNELVFFYGLRLRWSKHLDNL